jgi:hypothetical protein
MPLQRPQTNAIRGLLHFPDVYPNLRGPEGLGPAARSSAAGRPRHSGRWSAAARHRWHSSKARYCKTNWLLGLTWIQARASAAFLAACASTALQPQPEACLPRAAGLQLQFSWLGGVDAGKQALAARVGACQANHLVYSCSGLQRTGLGPESTTCAVLHRLLQGIERGSAANPNPSRDPNPTKHLASASAVLYATGREDAWPAAESARCEHAALAGTIEVALSRGEGACPPHNK